MRLNGIHHVTCITGDARRNLDFYTRVLGLRLVAKAVNQDDPFVYHLFYADEGGDPGSDLTFFEYPAAARGRAGAGMVHRIVWRVAGEDALAFWDARLRAEGLDVARTPGALRFADPEGLEHEFVHDRSGDAPLVAEHPEIPAAHALRGFDGVRAYARREERSRRVLESVMGAVARGEHVWELRGATRGGTLTWDEPPAEAGRPGAGTVHHVAWGAPAAEHAGWVERLRAGGVSSTDVVDRHWFHSIYFREPNGVLFEIADDAPGFTVDTPLPELGKRVELPPWFEPHRAEIEARLTPLPDPRAGWAARGAAS
jgi:glyoxalase family protein